MRTRRTFTNPSTPCICTECGVSAEAIPGKVHRKCGQRNGKVRQNGVQHTRIPVLFRGTWKTRTASPRGENWALGEGRVPSLMVA